MSMRERIEKAFADVLDICDAPEAAAEILEILQKLAKDSAKLGFQAARLVKGPAGGKVLFSATFEHDGVEDFLKTLEEK